MTNYGFYTQLERDDLEVEGGAVKGVRINDVHIESCEVKDYYSSWRIRGRKFEREEMMIRVRGMLISSVQCFKLE